MDLASQNISGETQTVSKRMNGLPSSRRRAEQLFATRSLAGRLTIISIALLVVASACSTEASRHTLQFFDAVSVPVDASRPGNPVLGRGAVATVRVTNDGSHSLRVVAIEPLGDAGVTIEYVGHSTCKKGCPGAETYTEDTAQMLARTIEGHYPIVVAPGTVQNLIFWIRAINSAASNTLRRTCYVGFKFLRVTFDDGSSEVIREPGYEVSIHLQNAHCLAAVIKSVGG
jgi:hypothetical protein